MEPVTESVPPPPPPPAPARATFSKIYIKNWASTQRTFYTLPFAVPIGTLSHTLSVSLTFSFMCWNRKIFTAYILWCRYIAEKYKTEHQAHGVYFTLMRFFIFWFVCSLIWVYRMCIFNSLCILFKKKTTTIYEHTENIREQLKKNENERNYTDETRQQQMKRTNAREKNNEKREKKWLFVGLKLCISHNL